MSEVKPKITLDQAVTYQIKIPGLLEKRWAHWNKEMMVSAGRDDHGLPVTTLTITVDQAALQGLLRRLYSLGLPLISVINVD